MTRGTARHRLRAPATRHPRRDRGPEPDLAPLTRNRADGDGTPNELQAAYYAQRAGAGLIISEGSQPSAIGQGCPNTPGVHTDAQQAGWARVTDAVHARGGRIVVQLMHAGRISHPDTLGGQTPVAPSALRPEGEFFTPDGTTKAFGTPREPRTDELAGVVAEYADATRRAVAAGLDGIELHGANGYLPHQFLADGVNRRTDDYGGSAENRARFVVEVARAVAAEIGADRVDIRLSPGHPFNDVSGSDLTVYPVLAGRLRELGLAYLHVLAEPEDNVLAELRELWPDRLVLNTGFGPDSDHDEMATLVDSGARRTRRPWAGRSWPTPTWWSAGPGAPSSTSPTRPSTAATGTATPTTRRWPRLPARTLPQAV
jgi:N-ethylmaleimide reductase